MSAEQKFVNSVATTLAADAGIGVTTLTIASPVIPTITAPDFYQAVLEPVGGGNIEVVKITGVSGTTITVERESEGSAGSAYVTGDLLQLRNTAGSMQRVGQKSDIGAQKGVFQPTIIDTALAVFINPTGSDTTGDGTLAAPWASLYKALTEASFLQFTATGSYTITCADGTYPMAAQVVFEHPQGDKIFITGTQATFTFPTPMPIGDYSGDRNAPVVPARDTNAFFNTCGTLPQSSNSATRLTARDSDAANNKALLKGQAGVVFEWSSSGPDEAKIVVITKIGGVSYCNFTFPTQDNSARAGFYVGPSACINFTDVTIWGSSAGVRAVNNSSVTATKLAISAAYYAVDVSGNSSMELTGPLYIQGLYNDGVRVSDNASLKAAEIIESGAGSRGIIAFIAGHVSGDTTTWSFSGNESVGALVPSGGSLSNVGKTINSFGNVSIGISSRSQAAVICGGFQAVGNSNGLEIGDNSLLRATGLSFSANNVSEGVIVENNSFIDAAAGMSISSNGGDAIRAQYGGAIVVTGALSILNNTGQVFTGNYCGQCNLGTLTCNLTNVASPHLQAFGGSIIKSIAPGVGGVDASIVYSPSFGTVAAPDSSLFTSTSLL